MLEAMWQLQILVQELEFWKLVLELFTQLNITL
jgi:hypothetical protein